MKISKSALFLSIILSSSQVTSSTLMASANSDVLTIADAVFNDVLGSYLEAGDAHPDRNIVETPQIRHIPNRHQRRAAHKRQRQIELASASQYQLQLIDVEYPDFDLDEELYDDDIYVADSSGSYVADIDHSYFDLGDSSSGDSGHFMFGDSGNDHFDFDDTGHLPPIGEIPLPAAFWLFMSGLLGLTGFAARRKSNRS